MITGSVSYGKVEVEPIVLMKVIGGRTAAVGMKRHQVASTITRFYTRTSLQARR